MKPLAEFKVFPGDTPHYWAVMVFKTKHGMRKAFHKLNECPDTDDRFGAIVMPQTRLVFADGSWQALPSLGYVLFAKTQLDTMTVVHEATHMAIEYLRQRSALPKLRTQDDEELLAHAVGWCAAGLVNELYKCKVYKK